MAGCFPNPKNKGRCFRCDFSFFEEQTSYCDNYKPYQSCGWLYCEYYQNYCKRVAWNCNAYPHGRKIK